MITLIIVTLLIVAAIYAYQAKAYKVSVGFQSLTIAVLSLYIFCVGVSIAAKWTAISHGTVSEGLQLAYNVINLITAIAFTDTPLHFALPTTALLVFALFNGDSLKSSKRQTIGLIIVGTIVSIAAAVIDYRICHHAGVLVSDGKYKQVAGELPKYQEVGQPITSKHEAVSVPQAKVVMPQNLKILASNGNGWAAAKMAEIQSRANAQTVAAQVKIAAAQSAAVAAQAKAHKATAEAVKSTNAAIARRDSINQARAERAENGALSDYALRSLVSSVGQFLCLVFLGYIAFMRKLHLEKSFFVVALNIFNVGATVQKNNRTDTVSSSSTGGETQTSDPEPSEKVAESVRKKQHEKDTDELKEEYRHKTAKQLQDAYSDARRDYDKYKKEGKDDLADRKMTLFRKLTTVHRELYGKENE